MVERVRDEEAQVVYLEPDDEIPTVIRRIRESGASAVILVAPGRAKAASSAIALRLLARVAAGDGTRLSLVAEPGIRSIAAEIGLAAFASVTEAQSGAPAAPPPARPRTAIRVVRAERQAPRAARVAPLVERPEGPVIEQPPVTRSTPGDETRPLRVAPAAPAAPARRSRSASAWLVPRWRALGRAGWLAIVAAVALVASAGAAILPAATIRITPAVALIGPIPYDLRVPAHSDTGSLSATLTGTATGKHVDTARAKGTAVFYNWTYVTVEVPRGTHVSDGKEVFTTDATIIVAAGQLVPPGFTVQPGTGAIAVTASEPGPDGNVPAGAIDTVDDRKIASRLRGFPNFSGRLVTNPSALQGGASTEKPEITKDDVTALVAAIAAQLNGDLATKLEAAEGRVYVPSPNPDKPVTAVPDGLIGTVGEESFELTGRLAYARTYALRSDFVSAAEVRLRADRSAVPAGRTLVDRSVTAAPTALAVAGNQVTARVAVGGSVIPTLDAAALKTKVAGHTAADVARILRPDGAAQVDLWPSWVSEVPRLDFRIEIVTEAPTGSAAPASIGTPSP